MLKNIKIKVKITMLVVILIISTIIISVLGVIQERKLSNNSLATMEQSMRKNYDEEIKNHVDSAISVIQKIYDDYEKGIYTEDEAKKIAADIVREMRYGKDGYFWIDTYDGDNIVLLGSKTEGTNRIDAEDANGYKMVADIIKHGKEGGGYTDYCFPKEGGKEYLPKRSYSQAFKPFKWVIGTGNYIDDIDKDIQDKENSFNQSVSRSEKMFFIITAFAVVLSILSSSLINHEIIKGFEVVTESLSIMASGNFKENIDKYLLNRKDDFGIIGNNLVNMKESIRTLICEAQNATEENTSSVFKIKENINELNQNIENVSAVTQQLAAGMEECAASSQEMSASAHEINQASKSIANKSQEGLKEAKEILEKAKVTREQVEEAKEKGKALSQDIEGKLRQAINSAKVVDKIDVLAQVILKIAEETNLLSLNAAIEAARAGESGRGFAVVAEQIRKLAEQSKDAVEGIQNVTKEVTGAVNSLLDNSNLLLNFLQTDVTSDYKNFSKVANEYENDAVFVENIVNDFNSTAEQLNESINNILIAIEEVAKTASEGASGTTEIAQKATDIYSKSEQMIEEVNVSTESSKKIQDEMNKFIV